MVLDDVKKSTHKKNGRQSGDFLCVLKFYSTSFSGWSYKEIQIDYVQMLPSSGLQLHYSIYFYKYFQHTFILKLMTRIFMYVSSINLMFPRIILKYWMSKMTLNFKETNCHLSTADLKNYSTPNQSLHVPHEQQLHLVSTFHT